MTSAPSGSPPPADSGITKGWFGRRRNSLCKAAPSLAAATFGIAVGYLTGVSGPDAVVLAAVLPAILSVTGIAAGFLSTRGDGGKFHIGAVSGLIVLFSIGLIVGTVFGAWARADRQVVELNKARTQLEEDRQAASSRHIEELKNCTILEFKMKVQRASLNLSPLTIWQVCPFLHGQHAAPIKPSE